MNIYSFNIVFEDLIKLTPIIYSVINCAFNFLCFAIINRNISNESIGAGRRTLMLTGSAIISPCLILMQILIWINYNDNGLFLQVLLTLKQ